MEIREKTMKAVTILLALFCLAGPLSAAINSGTAVMNMNNGLTFQMNNTLSRSIKDSQGYSIGVPCSPAHDSLDFFFFSRDCGTCMYYCPCELVGCGRAFYVSKKSINQIGSAPVNLTDSATFIPVRYTGICYPNNDSNKCFLPAVTIDHHGTLCVNYDWSQPLIVMTAIKKYAVLELVPSYSKSCDPMDTGYCRTYTSSVRVNWYLQTDGTTNFTGIRTSVTADHTRLAAGGTNGKFTSANATVLHCRPFDILGRTIRLNSAGMRGTATRRIVIDEHNTGIVLLFPGK
jgi:hypothetical protein